MHPLRPCRSRGRPVFWPRDEAAMRHTGGNRRVSPSRSASRRTRSFAMKRLPPAGFRGRGRRGKLLPSAGDELRSLRSRLPWLPGSSHRETRGLTGAPAEYGACLSAAVQSIVASFLKRVCFFPTAKTEETPSTSFSCLNSREHVKSLWNKHCTPCAFSRFLRSVWRLSAAFSFPRLHAFLSLSVFFVAGVVATRKTSLPPLTLRTARSAVVVHAEGK